MRGVITRLFWILIFSSMPLVGVAQSQCEVAEILFGPTNFDILQYGGEEADPDYETAIVRSATFDNPKKPFGAILGEITVDRGGFAVRNTKHAVVGVISSQLILEGWDNVCDKDITVEIVPVKSRSFVILSGGSPVGTIDGRFPKNSFGVSTE